MTTNGLTRPSSSSLLPLFVIAGISALLFIPFLGKVHLFDWDEINFAESAREMLVTGNYSRVMIDYKPFWEKPPLFFWMQASSMKIFGINEFAARFPNAVCGIFTLCLIFFLGRKYFDDTFGWLWILAYIGSFLPHFYFKSGIIDPWFNLFIFSAIVFLIRNSGQTKATMRNFLFAGIFTGLAILTKGPVALLIVVLAAAIFGFLKGGNRPNAQSLFAYFFSMFFISSLWFGMEVLQNGPWFIVEFIRYQTQLFSTGVAGHSGPIYYHALVLLIGCFPASIIAAQGFFKKQFDADAVQIDFGKWMMILFWVVLVLFSIVKTKIIHYSSLCYLPLTFLAAREMYFGMKDGMRFSWIPAAVLLVTGMVIGAAAAVVPVAGNNVHLLLPYVKDAVAKATLEADADWNAGLALIGIGYMVLLPVTLFSLRKNFRRSLMLLFAGTALFIQVIMYSFVPRIERYTQGAAIDFYKTLQYKDVYVEVLGFKSYAHLYYTQKPPPESMDLRDKEWLLHGDIDKPAYFVCKQNKVNEFSALPQLEEIGRKNGFVFFRRNVP